jgi:hypothetical protein
MSEEFRDMGDISSMLAARIASRKADVEGAVAPPGTFDPYQALLKKKPSENLAAAIDPSTIQTWPEEDVKKLQDYCQRNGIFGFNSGKMSPIAALAMLKQQVGDYSGVPLEERMPEGYEKAGTKSGYGPNYPYGEAMKRKLLHG